MANNYEKILELANANNMGLSNTIKRDFGIPLDFTSVQASYEAALTYAATNTLAYVGQPISVGDKLYIVTAESQGKYPETVEEGQTQMDVFLAEVGSATEGDGVTIDLEAGVLTLHGFEGALTGYLPRKSENGELEWVPISEVVQGDGNKVTTLTSEDGSVIITKKTDTDSSLVYDLKVEHPDAPEYAIAADERAEGATSTTYHLTKDGTNVDVEIVVPDAYNDTALAQRVADIESDYLTSADKYNDKDLQDRVKALEDEERYDETPLANRVTALETTVGDSTTGLVNGLAEEIARATDAESDLDERLGAIETDYIDSTKLANAIKDFATTQYVDEEIEAIEDAISKLNHFTAKVVDSLDKVTEVGVLYLIKDESVAGVDKYNEYIVVDNAPVLIGDTTTDLSNYYNKEEAEQLVEDRVSSVQSDLAEEREAREMLAERVVALEEIETVTQGEFADYKTTVTADIAKAKGEAIKDADDKLATKLSISDFEVFQTENTQAIEDAYDGAIGEIDGVKDDLIANYVTNTKLAEELDTLEDNLTKYADAELAKKANLDVVYTKGEIDLKIGTPGTPEVKDAEGNVTTAAVAGTGVFASTYSKAELNALLDEIEGGSTESAASVARQLETYISTNNERVTKIEAKDSTQDGLIAAAQTAADKGVADAATAQAAANEAKTLITTLETNKVDKNTTAIETIQGQITGDGGLSARIGALETKDTQHSTEFANLKAKVDTAVDTTIPAISANVSKNATAIAEIKTVLNGTEASGDLPATEGLIATVNKKANAADVYTKSQVDAKVITSGEVVHGTADSVTIANNKITVTVDSYTKGEVDTLLANLDQTELENGIAANADNIAILLATDKDENGKATKSVREIAKEEVALVVGAAPEALNTLEEVAAWIENDTTGAAAMANDIAVNKAILAGFGTGENEVATVKKYVDDAVAAVPQFTLEVATSIDLGGVKSSTTANKVAVASDGTMEVNSVGIEKLVMTEGYTLVLDGGSAAI